ncbi:MAG TPA: amidohydrolase family protein, partial [Nordella sp.]|nr:amidohydrolase family protein [Nordella sp.]
MACNPGMVAVLKNAASRRDFLKYMRIATTSAFAGTALASVSGPAFAQSGEPADVVFWGGSVLTMNAAAPRAEALAIRGDRILAVGGKADMQALSGPKTRIVDLEGRTVMPGFVEPHMHSTFVALDD